MYKMTAVFVISVLLLAGTANAQGGKNRFLERKWIGLGLIAGGALTAFVGNKQCRLDGPTTSTRLVEGRQNDRPFTTTYTHEKRLGHCDMLIRSEFLGSVSWIYYNNTSAAAPGRRGVGVPLTKPEAYKGKARLYGGVAMMAVGALLATVWADVPALKNVDVEVNPRGEFSIGKTFSF